MMQGSTRPESPGREDGWSLKGLMEKVRGRVPRTTEDLAYRWRWDYGAYSRVDPNHEYFKNMNKNCIRPPSELAVFWTVGPGAYTKAIVEEEWQMLRSSGLLATSKRVVVNAHDWLLRHGSLSKDRYAWRKALLPPNASAESQGKLEDVPLDSRAEPLYEFPTLNALWQHCQRHPKGFVLNMHTKGSTYKERGSGSSKNPWRENMMHFCVRRYATCVRHLSCGYSMCGPNLDWRPENKHKRLEYSGNFWWAR
jgi:hypothetical protein